MPSFSQSNNFSTLWCGESPHTLCSIIDDAFFSPSKGNHNDENIVLGTHDSLLVGKKRLSVQNCFSSKTLNGVAIFAHFLLETILRPMDYTTELS